MTHLNYIPSFEELEAHSTSCRQVYQYLMRLKTDAPQSPKWHPEGNTYIHTKIVYNKALKSRDINLALAAFFHDLGKADTTKRNKAGNWAAHGHEVVSARLVERHQGWITYWGGDWEVVHWIVLNHMRMKQFDEMRKIKQKALTDHPNFKDLKFFSEKCDNAAEFLDVWVASDLFNAVKFWFKRLLFSAR